MPGRGCGDNNPPLGAPRISRRAIPTGSMDCAIRMYSVRRACQEKYLRPAYAATRRLADSVSVRASSANFANRVLKRLRPKRALTRS